MVAPTTAGPLTQVGTDLDEFAVTLADLASAVDRREVAEVLAHLHDLTLHDVDVATVLGDFLSTAGLLTDQEVCDR